MTIKTLIDQKIYNEPLQTILQLIEWKETSSRSFADVLKKHNMEINDIHDDAVKVIIDFVNLILDDHIITNQEMAELRRLKQVLHIQEGDFVAAHKEEVIKDVLCRELKLIYNDKVVDTDEAAMKVNLQELFGLSYDQFLEFEQEAVEQALKDGANISDLDTFYRL